MGHGSSHSLIEDRKYLDFRRITVSDPKVAGRTVGELAMDAGYGATISRVRRGDVDMVGTPDLVLQLGDRVRVVAPTGRMAEITRFFGDSARGLSSINPVAMGLGMALGIIIGNVARAIGVKFLRDATLDQLNAVKGKVSDEDYIRAEYVIEEIQRVLDVCDALEKGDYETVGKKMYETHEGMSKLYEVSCEELDFLNNMAHEYGVTGSRVMGGSFNGCTINMVKDELYEPFVTKAKEAYRAKYNRSPKVYDVVIGDGARKVCE